MKGKTLFSEEQKFRQPWLWFMLIALFSVPGVLLWGVIRQILQGQPFGNNPMSDTGLVILFLLVLVLTILTIVMFLMIRLDTSITGSEIGVRFYPFHRSFHYYKWEDISKENQ